MPPSLPATSTLPWPIFLEYSSTAVLVLILFSLTLAYIGAEMSGWKALQRLYATTIPYTGQAALQPFVEMGLFQFRLSFMLRLGMDINGLYLVMKPLEFAGFHPVYIPWEDVTVRTVNVFLTPKTVVTISGVPHFVLVFPGTSAWLRRP